MNDTNTTKLTMKNDIMFKAFFSKKENNFSIVCPKNKIILLK